MQIEPLVDFQNAKDFLLPYEADCVQLASYVRKGMENLFVIKDNESTVGIIYAKGTLLHCIPGFTDCAGSLTKVLSDFLLAHQVKCVNGSSTVTEAIKALLQSQGRLPTQTNHYRLMTLPAGSPLPAPADPLVNDDEIRRCANPEHDADLLFALQKAYLIEEVAPAGKNPGELEINVILKQIIKNQICLALFSDGEPVAKANTNAIGWKCVQVGGVYTNPLYRRNGYAQTLVSNLCARILRTGRTVTLYVKEKNTAARALYQKLGFQDREGFEIVYFS